MHASYLNIIMHVMSSWLFHNQQIQSMNKNKAGILSKFQSQTAPYQAPEGTRLSPKALSWLKEMGFFAVKISKSHLPAQTLKDPFDTWPHI